MFQAARDSSIISVISGSGYWLLAVALFKALLYTHSHSLMSFIFVNNLSNAIADVHWKNPVGTFVSMSALGVFNSNCKRFLILQYGILKPGSESIRCSIGHCGSLCDILWNMTTLCLYIAGTWQNIHIMLGYDPHDMLLPSPQHLYLFRFLTAFSAL